jgi:hypothetical protein
MGGWYRPPFAPDPGAVATVADVSPGTFTFRAELWEHQGKAAWFFVSLPEEVADDIEEQYGHRAKGFGSVPVEVTIGATTWTTSIFPDDKRGTYLLPVKKPVRNAEDLADGSRPEIALTVVMP